MCWYILVLRTWVVSIYNTIVLTQITIYIRRDAWLTTTCIAQLVEHCTSNQSSTKFETQLVEMCSSRQENVLYLYVKWRSGNLVVKNAEEQG